MIDSLRFVMMMLMLMMLMMMMAMSNPFCVDTFRCPICEDPSRVRRVLSRLALVRSSSWMLSVVRHQTWWRILRHYVDGHGTNRGFHAWQVVQQHCAPMYAACWNINRADPLRRHASRWCQHASDALPSHVRVLEQLYQDSKQLTITTTTKINVLRSVSCQLGFESWAFLF